MGKYNLFDVADTLKLSQRTATKGRGGNSHVATETQHGTWSKGQKDRSWITYYKRNTIGTEDKILLQTI